MQLITNVNRINGNTTKFFRNIFFIDNLFISIITKFKIKKSKISGLFGRKNMLVVYMIKTKNLITLLMINHFP